MEIRAIRIEEFEHEMDTEEFILRFRDVGRFEDLCKQCGNYGKRWGCPPLIGEHSVDLNIYKNVKVVCLKIVLEPAEGVNNDEMVRSLGMLIQKVRRQYEGALLEKERSMKGRAALFTGMCPHCGSEECARVSGKPCRHPELVRPSLEAMGFDLGKAMSEIFGIRLLWVEDKKAPAYLCLVGAVFY